MSFRVRSTFCAYHGKQTWINENKTQIIEAREYYGLNGQYRGTTLKKTTYTPTGSVTETLKMGYLLKNNVQKNIKPYVVLLKELLMIKYTVYTELQEQLKILEAKKPENSPQVIENMKEMLEIIKKINCYDNFKIDKREACIRKVLQDWQSNQKTDLESNMAYYTDENIEPTDLTASTAISISLPIKRLSPTKKLKNDILFQKKQLKNLLKNQTDTADIPFSSGTATVALAQMLHSLVVEKTQISDYVVTLKLLNLRCIHANNHAINSHAPMLYQTQKLAEKLMTKYPDSNELKSCERIIHNAVLKLPQEVRNRFEEPLSATEVAELMRKCY